MVQQAQAETEQVVKVGLKLFQELGERARKLAVEVSLYRDMAVQLAAREGVDVPDFVKDDSGGLKEEQVGQLREWLGRLAAGEEPVTTTTMTTRRRTPSRKRGRLESGISRGKRGGKDDDVAVAQ